MSLEISKIKNADNKTFATQCDANNDGKLDEKEMLVFEEGKKIVKDDCGVECRRIGGVLVATDIIDKIQFNGNGADFDYSLTLNNGVNVQYDRQSLANNAMIEQLTPFNAGDTFTAISGVLDGDGFKAQGTDANDRFWAMGSLINNVDGGKGEDYLRMYGCKFSEDLHVANVEDGKIEFV